MTAIQIRSVEKAFGDSRVLKGIDLDVPAGSFTTILGPSGCGKTTLLRIIAGFIRPDSGVLRFGEQLVADERTFLPARSRRVGYVAQEGALFPHLDVAANIAFGLSRRERKTTERVSELLELVGLDQAYLHRYPHQLSGGQQQRVALARALAPRPAVVLLDEPFASLDAGLRVETGLATSDALRTANATAIMVTHDQDEALSLADQVAVMREGLLIQVGSPTDVYKNPVDTGVAAFVGDAVLLNAEVKGEHARTPLGYLFVGTAAPQGKVRLVVRPEQVRLFDHPTAVSVEAKVESVSYYGHDASVRLLLNNGERLSARLAGIEPPELQQVVHVGVTGDVKVFPPETDNA